MIAIVDLGIGNYANVARATAGEITSDPYTIGRSEKIILPGVGSASAVANALESVRGTLMDRINDGTPVLGICLGMQLLTSESQEGDVKGLGIFDGITRKMTSEYLPHIGWNTLITRKDHGILKGVNSGSYFYFIHSYSVLVDEELVVAKTEYRGEDFPSVIAKDNVVGVQFHPEKSSDAGRKVLDNFIRGVD